jgi:Uma2 family endonuclease
MLTLPELQAPPPAEDPFRYGYREVRRRRPGGGSDLLQMPLTLWDLLHPQVGDRPMHGLRHARECRYLWSVLEARVADDPHALVLNDTPVYWDVPGIGHHSPDVALIFDVERPRDDWPSFHVAFEGVRPALLLEVVSPASRDNDVVAKLADYHRALVPLYVIVDRVREEDWPTICGYRYRPDAYEPTPLDGQGCLLLEVVGLKLGTVQNRVVLYDARTGEEVGDYAAVCEALEVEMAARRAAEERARAAEEQARAEAQARQAAEEQARAAAEARRQAEDQARHLEARLRELEALLGQRPDAPAG